VLGKTGGGNWRLCNWMPFAHFKTIKDADKNWRGKKLGAAHTGIGAHASRYGCARCSPGCCGGSTELFLFEYT